MHGLWGRPLWRCWVLRSTDGELGSTLAQRARAAAPRAWRVRGPTAAPACDDVTREHGREVSRVVPCYGFTIEIVSHTHSPPAPKRESFGAHENMRNAKI